MSYAVRIRNGSGAYSRHTVSAKDAPSALQLVAEHIAKKHPSWNIMFANIEETQYPILHVEPQETR